jgi:serine phosphatase RsbU (regulator of sigma subunit)
MDQAAEQPARLAGAVRTLTRGWLLPYLVVLAVVAADLAVGGDLSLVAFLVLSPLLASRLSTDRRQVLSAGVAALGAAVVLGELNHELATGQQLARLLLVVVGTLVALINQGVVRREQSALERAADTITMAALLAAGVEPDEAYQLLARSARSLYAADAAAVYRRAGEHLLLEAGDRHELIPPMPSRLSRARMPNAFATHPVQASVRSAAEPEAAMLEARGLGSLLWLPLLDPDGGQTGAIALAWRRRDPRLTAEALVGSQQFADLGARAISGSERARAQAEVLERVQALLLSTPPGWAQGYRVAVRYQSASGLAQIGGDFYDLIEVDDGRGLAFLLADARGKGLEASSLASVLKGAFRSLAGEGANPARILARLDRVVAREGGEEDFVTALAGRAHPDGRLVLASAGHPYPLGDGPRPAAVGAPLGLGTRAAEAHGRLHPGQRLVCYTDGLVEARNEAGAFIDRDRFEQAVRAGTLDDALDRLVAMVNEHSADHRADDLALLGLECAPDR